MAAAIASNKVVLPRVPWWIHRPLISAVDFYDWFRVLAALHLFISSSSPESTGSFYFDIFIIKQHYHPETEPNVGPFFSKRVNALFYLLCLLPVELSYLYPQILCYITFIDASFLSFVFTNRAKPLEQHKAWQSTIAFSQQQKAAQTWYIRLHTPHVTGESFSIILFL